VANFLIHHGYEVIPVNPSVDEVLGQRCYPNLASIPEDAGVEVVDIFRRAEDAGGVVDEAIELGADGIWMQLGVIDRDAARRAEESGLEVVMDHCPAIELPRLL
jgi:predicted CoA-binding protein